MCRQQQVDRASRTPQGLKEEQFYVMDKTRW